MCGNWYVWVHAKQIFSVGRSLQSPSALYTIVIQAFSRPSYLQCLTWVQQQHTMNFLISNQVQQQQVQERPSALMLMNTRAIEVRQNNQVYRFFVFLSSTFVIVVAVGIAVQQA